MSKITKQFMIDTLDGLCEINSWKQYSKAMINTLYQEYGYLPKKQWETIIIHLRNEEKFRPTFSVIKGKIDIRGWGKNRIRHK